MSNTEKSKLHDNNVRHCTKWSEMLWHSVHFRKFVNSQKPRRVSRTMTSLQEEEAHVSLNWITKNQC